MLAVRGCFLRYKSISRSRGGGGGGELIKRTQLFQLQGVLHLAPAAHIKFCLKRQTASTCLLVTSRPRLLFTHSVDLAVEMS